MLVVMRYDGRGPRDSATQAKQCSDKLANIISFENLERPRAWEARATIVLSGGKDTLKLLELTLP